MSSRSVDGPRYLFDSWPEPGECWPVCEHVQWLRMPLPFALNHVNCWLLGEASEQVLVDTGIDSASTKAIWQQVFGRAPAATSSASPAQLLVTHYHPDHMGLAGWFYEAGCTLYGSAIEAAQARQIWSIPDEEYGDIQAAWYAANGLPDRAVAAVRNRANSYRRIVHRPPPLEAWTHLAQGQSVQLGGEEFQVMTGRGHAPDMIMLFRTRDQVLLSADQILPGISPNVSCMPRLQDQNPLHSFLSILNELKSLPEETLVLPSHGIPFRGLHARIDALRLHHEHRLHDVLHACREPVSAHDLFHLLFCRKLDAQQMSFALGESLAHLHYLEHEGEIVRQVDRGTTLFVSPATG